MKIAIMQPYFFPYIGYFQLINAVDKFIVYDDVNYIKQGWINRNRILLNNNAFFLTVQLKGASSFKKINEIEININKSKLLKTIYQAYNRAFYFNEVYKLIESIIRFNESNLARFVLNSLFEISKYLNINSIFLISSEICIAPELKGQERILKICRQLDASNYYNAIGGVNLYSKAKFLQDNVKLKFIRPKSIIYNQFDGEFIPNLSIIDVLMFNPKERVIQMLNEYELLE